MAAGEVVDLRDWMAGSGWVAGLARVHVPVATGLAYGIVLQVVE